MLTGNDTSHDQSTYEITKIDKNVKFKQKYSERLVFKPFLILGTNYHDIYHIWYLLATGTPCGTHGSLNK